MTTTTSWALWLAARLAERDWTQADLIRASSPRLDDGNVSRWLDGKIVPQLASIRIACRALGVPAVEGMIAAGRLEAGDVGVTLIRTRPRAADLSAREFSEEAERRFRIAESVESEADTSRPISSILGREGEGWAAKRARPGKADTKGVTS